MADNEQELLEITLDEADKCRGWASQRKKFIDGKLQAQVAKLKAMGWTPPDECPECGGDGRQDRHFDRCFSNRCPNCNGYGWIKRVKWDREKVESILIKMRNDALKVNAFRQPIPDYHALADQLKEILTGGE